MVFIFLIISLIYFLFLIKVIIALKNINNKNDIEKNVDEYISVIIPFRNESKNILKNLESIENLCFENNKYEVVYIDDNSEDDTALKLQNNIKNENIRVLKYKNDKLKGKKNAVKFAINNCKGELIFTTDADCIVQKDWLKETVQLFDYETAFVSGIVKFSDKDGFWNKLQQLEFSGLVIVGGGLIFAGYPTICNAANLAFRKSVFLEVGGFDDNLHLTSGDDELLMQKIALLKKYKIKFLFNKNTVVSTHPNNTLKDFYNQRVRWASKGFHYQNPLLILFLITIYLFFLSFPLLLLLGVFVNKLFIGIFIFNFLIKILLESKILLFGKNVLFNKFNAGLIVIAEVLHIPYIIIAGFMGTFGKFRWKGSKHKK
jgi:cellulose synthase/poly-beta-1,6-N-acetylglucosamine synthase-like glycosyltransferase